MERKSQRYTVLDNFYFDVLDLLSREVNRKEIPFVVVGGAAYQAKIASLVTNNGEKDLRSLESLIFRMTGDIDLAVLSDHSSMVTLFNEVAASYSNFCVENKINKKVRISRGGNSLFVNYQTEASDLEGLTNYYEDIIKTAETVRLRKGNKTVNIPIPKFEYLIVSKLIRSKEKDKVDIYNLLQTAEKKGTRPNFEEIRSILKAIGKESRFDYIEEIFYDLYGN